MTTNVHDLLSERLGTDVAETVLRDFVSRDIVLIDGDYLASLRAQVHASASGRAQLVHERDRLRIRLQRTADELGRLQQLANTCLAGQP